MLARVSLGDNLADAGLVEAFEAFVALKVLQVCADGAMVAELLGLEGSDVAALKRLGDTPVGRRASARLR